MMSPTWSARARAGARREGDIGFAVLRGGDVTGEHSVIFYGDPERVETSHRATDRAILRGALRAARFAAAANPGFYSMEDVLAGSTAETYRMASVQWRRHSET